MKVGGLVRLNEQGLKWATNRQNHPLKWKDRVGQLYRLSRDKNWCRVLWSGRRSLSDDLPTRFLEEVS